MGERVVFHVSLDSDDVAVESKTPRPAHHLTRDAALSLARDRRWHAAFGAAALAPAIASLAFAVGVHGEWATTAFLIVATMATVASGAWAAAKPFHGDRSARAARWAVVGIAGSLLAFVQVPGLVWAAHAEVSPFESYGPTLLTLAFLGAAGAWLGFAVGNIREPWSARAATTLAVALTLAPLALFASVLSSTYTTDTITAYEFATGYENGRELYVCAPEELQVRRLHTESVAWIALASPVAWSLDSRELTPHDLVNAADGSLANAQAWIRSTRVGPDDFWGHCYQSTSLGVPNAVREGRYSKHEAIGPTLAMAAALGCAIVSAATLRRRSTR